MKRLTITEFEMLMVAEEKRLEFVEEKLKAGNFDLNRHYNVSKGYNNSGYVFTQKAY